MDFARKHIYHESVATLSRIRHINVDGDVNGNDNGNVNGNADVRVPLDDMLVQAANQAAADLFQTQTSNADSSLYPERLTPQTETIQPDQLVVIFESFDNLNFCYAKSGEIFSNRNGHFHHDDFIGKPYGCKIRSRNNRGYGFVYLLKPTPELWARSLKHRTQIVHELDASMIVFYLNLRPNMIVCESGTGSGALSHCILRTIAPAGHLYTYEFNHLRSEAARQEFAKNRVDHLVTVYHKDVCGTSGAASNQDNEGADDPSKTQGGFDRPQASVDAIVLDLPQPWLAVPHAAFTLKPNARIASYSPCVEQSQRTIETLKQCGFHSITTKEFRLKEHYVDEVEYELAPKEKRPRFVNTGNSHLMGAGGVTSGGEDTGAEADNERSEYETEGDQASLATAGTLEQDTNLVSAAAAAKVILNSPPQPVPPTLPATTSNNNVSATTTITPKRKKVLVARPFASMRGHTAFLTFATAGNKLQPNPNRPGAKEN
jgi:tRNA (adenine57-N1/adenine58-N1)-methyltransferase